MFRKILLPFLCSSFFWFSNQAQALVTASAGYTYQLITTETALNQELKTSGHGYALSLHLDPIPLVPISFGASATLLDLLASDFGAYDKVALAEFALEAKVWLPMVPVVKPYALINLPVAGKLVGTPKDVLTTKKIETHLTGFEAHLGLKTHVLPFTELFLDAGLGQKNAEKLFDKEREFNSMIYTVGVEVGI